MPRILKWQNSSETQGMFSVGVFMTNEKVKGPLLNTFLQGFHEAVKRIGPHFFRIIIAGSNQTLFRERVYCYELYHQLQCVLKGFPLRIYGEVDKSGHPRRHERRAPDFIVHDPGREDCNLVIVEVKSTRSKRGRFLKDIGVINKYVCSYGYHHGILLLVGSKMPKNRLSDYDQFVKRQDGRIQMLWHREKGKFPEVIRPNSVK